MSPGLPELGIRAAADMGVALERLVMVTGDPPWVDVLAAMIDGFDVILVGQRVGRLASGAVRRLQARAQSRGVVMLTIGVPALGADLRVTADDDQWFGLGNGHGVATGRRVLVEVGGRRMPRARQADDVAPSDCGGVVQAPKSARRSGQVTGIRRDRTIRCLALRRWT